jgi:hypothetical protein
MYIGDSRFDNLLADTYSQTRRYAESIQEIHRDFLIINVPAFNSLIDSLIYSSYPPAVPAGTRQPTSIGG